jgi:hypothetical protein
MTAMMQNKTRKPWARGEFAERIYCQSCGWRGREWSKLNPCICPECGAWRGLPAGVTRGDWDTEVSRWEWFPLRGMVWRRSEHDRHVEVDVWP